MWVADSLVQETLQVGVVLRERRWGNPYSPPPSAEAFLPAGEESPNGSCLLYSCIHVGWYSWPLETQEQGMFCP